jgi:hypothetical protein
MRALALVVVTIVACGGPRAKDERPVVATADAAVTAAAPPDAAPPPPPDAAPPDTPAGPVPYPAAWIDDARSANAKHSCQNLVYKRGCAEVRTGRVELGVTLDDAGHVTGAHVVSNTILTDPKLVEKCLLRELHVWTFHPPDGVAHDLVVTVILSDMC